MTLDHILQCQVCGDPMRENIVGCARCSTIHHKDCFEYNGKCSTFGCAETRFSPVSNLDTLFSRVATGSAGIPQVEIINSPSDHIQNSTASLSTPSLNRTPSLSRTPANQTPLSGYRALTPGANVWGLICLASLFGNLIYNYPLTNTVPHSSRSTPVTQEVRNSAEGKANKDVELQNLIIHARKHTLFLMVQHACQASTEQIIGLPYEPQEPLKDDYLERLNLETLRMGYTVDQVDHVLTCTSKNMDSLRNTKPLSYQQLIDQTLKYLKDHRAKNIPVKEGICN